MKPFVRLLGLSFLLAFCAGLPSCMEDTPPDFDHNPPGNKELSQVKPISPTSQDEVKVITYDCKYYALASVTERGKDFTIKKRFNSQMKWPCVLVYDSISLGKLKQGNYTVFILIVDTNPMVTDSISSVETLEIRVTK